MCKQTFARKFENSDKKMASISGRMNRRKANRRKLRESLTAENGELIFVYSGKTKVVAGPNERRGKERRKPTLKGLKLQLAEIKELYEAIKIQKLDIGRHKFLQFFRYLNEAEKTANALLGQYRQITRIDTTEVQRRVKSEISYLQSLRTECHRIIEERKSRNSAHEF
jgi:hypothetical protein